MSINFATQFGAPAAPTAGNAAKPKAQFWINIGVLSNVKDESTGELRFVSLAQGIALDTMETLPTSGKTSFAQLNAARNDLRDQLVDLAKQLKPGQSEYLALTTEGRETGLKVQVRRVAEETQATAGEGNPFSVKLAIGAAA